MMLNARSDYRPDPHLYLQLGELIAQTGGACFAEQMLRLVQDQVSIDGLEISEWTLDAPQLTDSRVEVLGRAGVHARQVGSRSPHPLLQSIEQMHDPLLIEFKAPEGSNPRNLRPAHQCHLVSCSGTKRWVISAYRLPCERRFSLAELSQLKSLSSTLLPLVEHHGQLLDHDGTEVTGQALDDAEVGRLQQTFGRRLMQASVKLSVREQEVCVGLLSGWTVPELARQLNVKSSSVETYLKRAAAKLGVSGRNGLTKWMTAG
ncbi:helix-turn-helix transcriptional regulator [Pseudomonas fulva]|uniref:helix-turn-helix transcriptional regulator n=1 Tax=Pseudomonas fulva TaxID=47880 RepID=UPI0018A9292F|nr:helix-turn-helix transcriptional regulator [Pseudomonas fulva]MBF8774895.1 helix-turn-helix transcriptional regulator [Pseudomonas fulva]